MPAATIAHKKETPMDLLTPEQIKEYEAKWKELVCGWVELAEINTDGVR